MNIITFGRQSKSRDLPSDSSKACLELSYFAWPLYHVIRPAPLLVSKIGTGRVRLQFSAFYLYQSLSKHQSFPHSFCTTLEMFSETPNSPDRLQQSILLQRSQRSRTCSRASRPTEHDSDAWGGRDDWGLGSPARWLKGRCCCYLVRSEDLYIEKGHHRLAGVWFGRLASRLERRKALIVRKVADVAGGGGAQGINKVMGVILTGNCAMMDWNCGGARTPESRRYSSSVRTLLRERLMPALSPILMPEERSTQVVLTEGVTRWTKTI